MITAIVPNYNHSAYVEASIRSLLEQSRPPDEMIVIDDASTDDSLEVIERALKGVPNVKIIVNPTRQGVIYNLNHGLRKARGEYVFFGAADDTYFPRFLEQSTSMLAGHPEAGFCCGNMVLLNRTTGVTNPYSMPLGNRACCFTAEDLVVQMRQQNFAFSTSTVILRRNAALLAGGFIPELRWHSDWFLNFVAAFRHGFCFIPEDFVVVDFGGPSYSGQRHDWTKQSEVIRAIIERLRHPEYADVLPRFRRAAALPTLDQMALPMLLRDPTRRDYLTPLLAWRLLLYAPLYRFGAATPSKLKRALRRIIRV